MSTPASAPPPKNEIRIIQHSTLFYWWPVWVVGFLLSLITLFSGQKMVTVPNGTELAEVKSYIINNETRTPEKGGARAALVAPEGKGLTEPHLHMTGSKNLGVLFVTVLLLVITITNVPLRGLWSVIVIIIIVSVCVILAIMDKWEVILEKLSVLDIRINLAGYFVVSLVLFVLWLVVFLFFDRQIYMTFTPGQFRVRLEIGDAETAYDTTGMSVQKQRSDLFRHWILGLGSGDLIVNTAGAAHHQFNIHNVLFIGRKVKEIEEMLRSRQVVAGPG